VIVDTIYGFLGSGKTTFITHILREWGKEERIVVLVNEFGDVGIDGSLLAGYGRKVVELPSGCICCSLQADFKRQLIEIRNLYQPDRVLVEPSGVASITQIEAILGLEAVDSMISERHNIVVIDAKTFMEYYKANSFFVSTQLRRAHLAILNKCDLVERRIVSMAANLIVSIKPEVYVIPTSYCRVNWDEYTNILRLSEKFSLQENFGPYNSSHEDTHEDHDHSHFNGQSIGLGYQSIGRDLGSHFFRHDCLVSVFQDMLEKGAKMGEIVRAKGIFLTEKGWELIEVASGVMSFQKIQEARTSKIAVIGKGLNQEFILAAFEGCSRG